MRMGRCPPGPPTRGSGLWNSMTGSVGRGRGRMGRASVPPLARAIIRQLTNSRTGIAYISFRQTWDRPPMSQAPSSLRQMTVGQFDALFPTDDACKAYLVARRWPDWRPLPTLRQCQAVARHRDRPFHWLCTQMLRAEGYRFSVLVGTMFENTKIGLRDWFRVIHLMLTAKKGVAALASSAGARLWQLQDGSLHVHAHPRRVASIPSSAS